jgi:hypothetical protein
MEKGTKVRHTRHGFEGVVIDNHFTTGNVIVRIEKGDNPYTKGKGTFVANVKSLEVLAAESPEQELVDELVKAFAELDELLKSTNNNPVHKTDDNSTFEVELALADGTEIRFGSVKELIEFMEYMEGKNK